MLTLRDRLSRLGAEEQLLLAGAHVRLSAPQRERLRSLAGLRIDWGRLIARAEAQKVLPLLARHLLAECPEQLPPPVAAELRDAGRAIARQNLFLSAELLRVLDLLKQHGIRAFPFKGPALAAQVYGDPGLRRYGDLDIWIEPQSFLRARELLMAEGYVPYEPPPDELLPRYTGLHHEYGFKHGASGVRLELLWRMIERPFAFPLQVERLWAALEPAPLAGRSVPAIPRDLLLICLCVHGSKHLWERLIWVCDVAETLQALGEVDWERLLETAQSYGATRMLLLGLFLAHSLLEAPLPAAVLQRCRADRQVAQLADLALTLLLDGMSDEVFQTLHLYQLRMLDRLGDRLRVVRRYAYSFLNPLHVYRKYGLGPVRHLLGR